jgi:hypothetical protein
MIKIGDIIYIKPLCKKSRVVNMLNIKGFISYAIVDVYSIFRLYNRQDFYTLYELKIKNLLKLLKED